MKKFLILAFFALFSANANALEYAEFEESQETFFIGIEAGYMSAGNFLSQAKKRVKRARPDASEMNMTNSDSFMLRFFPSIHVKETKIRLGIIYDICSLPNMDYTSDSVSFSFGDGVFTRTMANIEYFIFGNAKDNKGIALSASVGKFHIVHSSMTQEKYDLKSQHDNDLCYEAGIAAAIRISTNARLTMSAMYAGPINYKDFYWNVFQATAGISYFMF